MSPPLRLGLGGGFVFSLWKARAKNLLRRTEEILHTRKTLHTCKFLLASKLVSQQSTTVAHVFGILTS
jgi:hypothetical protein